MKHRIQNKSTITAKWVFENKEYDIPDSSISYVIFDYDYDHNNMPIALMILNVKISLYNKMVNNVDDATIFLKIMSFNNNEENPSKTEIIKDQFKYYIPSDNDTHEDISEESAKMTGDEQGYCRVTIGLIKQRVLDDNRKFFKDCVYRNINRNTLMYLGLKHVKKLCIRVPDTTNKVIDQIVMPPLTSVNEYLKYIDYTQGLYELGYRYFHDYDITYMLDEGGTYVSNGTGEYKTVMIDVGNNVKLDSASEGYCTDVDKNMYIIDVPAVNEPITVDNITQTATSTIVSVGTKGIESVVEMSDDKKEKAVYIRGGSSNKRSNFEAKKYKNTISVSKSQIDGSFITPNKAYMVKNYEKYSEYNGVYILYRKQVVFAHTAGNFIPTVSISLRKKI